MSYWNVPKRDYIMRPEGTPGWEDAPVPGWGANPYRAGPARVGVGGCGCSGVGADAEASVLNSPWFWGASVIGMLVLVNMADTKTRHMVANPGTYVVSPRVRAAQRKRAAARRKRRYKVSKDYAGYWIVSDAVTGEKIESLETRSQAQALRAAYQRAWPAGRKWRA